MADFLQIISTLREQMHAALSRSDILRPMTWLVGLLLTATVGSVAADGPNWLTITLLVFLGFSLALYLFAYVYCLFNTPDALRSERYSIQKMAIEHGLMGDSNTGLFDPDARERIIESSTKKIGHMS